MNTTTMFSRAATGGRDDWETPADLFATLDREFHFTLDAAARADNRRCDRWLGPGSPLGEDALTADWAAASGGGAVWCNPPYSTILHWVLRALTQPIVTVMLIPSRTDTRWFGLVWDFERHQPRPHVSVRFLPGRVKFRGAQNSAPFPSLLVIFDGLGRFAQP